MCNPHKHHLVLGRAYGPLESAMEIVSVYYYKPAIEQGDLSFLR
ncbi:hypothetical protein [Nitrosomonas aestuarii]|nr:hypothetical protein [Nitrosomonas aestuarii]PTN12590.1 hypothetical protein C8R11_103158 [Nitrosomonas aestuarii]